MSEILPSPNPFPGTGSAVTGVLPCTVANADLAGQTAAVASVAAYTTLSPGTYRIGGYVNITAIATDVLQFQVAWTDEASNSRTLVFFPMGVTSANLAATGFYGFPTADIRVKSGTAITVSTVLITGTGSITYDVGANIARLY